MKLAIVVAIELGVSPLGLGGELKANLKILSDLGYEGIEPFVAEPRNLDVQRIKKLVRDYGLGISGIGTGITSVKYGWNFTSSDASIRKRAIERISEYIKLAGELETDVIIGSVKGKYETSYEQGWSHLKDCLTQCLAIAKDCGVHILLEPLNRYESNIINTLGEGVRLIEEISSDQIKLLADTFHMNIEERSIHDSLVDAKQWLAHIHFSDSNRLAPGQGHLDFRKIVKTLRQINYDKWITAEILPKPDQQKAAKLTIEQIKSVL